MEQFTFTDIGHKMNRPLIQIDDLVREMTDEEFASYEEHANAPTLGEPE